MAVVTFERFHPHLSPTHRSIYTELDLRSEQLLKYNRLTVQNGDTLTVILRGGTIALPNGRVISQAIAHELYTLQPSHRYLVFFRHETPGDYYTVAKSWELRDGKAQPNSPDDVIRKEKGVTAFAGMSETEFLERARRAAEQANRGLGPAPINSP